VLCTYNALNGHGVDQICNWPIAMVVVHMKILPNIELGFLYEKTLALCASSAPLKLSTIPLAPTTMIASE